MTNEEQELGLVAVELYEYFRQRELATIDTIQVLGFLAGMTTADALRDNPELDDPAAARLACMHRMESMFVAGYQAIQKVRAMRAEAAGAKP